MSASYTSAMKAAVCTRYGPPEVVVISEVDKPAMGDSGLLVKGPRDHSESDGLCLPGGQALLHEIPHRPYQATVDGPGH
jgi:hypothetical protein